MPISDDHLRALGRVVVNFQSLESYISFWVLRFIGPDQAIGQMVTAQLPFGKLCVLARSLFDHKFGTTRFEVRFTELLDRSLKLEEKRNQLFHSIWLTDDASGGVSRLKISLRLGKGLTRSSTPVTPQDINGLADDMSKTATALVELILEMKKDGLGIRA